MLAALKINADAACLTKPKLESLTRAFNQLTECQTCDGNKPKCKRVIISADQHGNITTSATPCQKQIDAERATRARNIIKANGVPTRFANMRAKDFRAMSANDDAISAAEAAIFDNQSIFIFGTVGTGKTLLACIIANELAFQNKPCLFTNVPELLDSLRIFPQRDDLPAADIQRYCRATRLIVDDIGAEKITDWAREILFKLFNYRYNECLQTITTSNFSPQQLRKHLGERISRRILHDAIVAEILKGEQHQS